MPTDEQINQMRHCGFVHVTSLRLKNNEDKNIPGLAVIADPGEYGCWDRASGLLHNRFLLITTEGEVWIMGGDLGDISFDLLDELCPNGRRPKAWWPTFWDLNPDEHYCSRDFHLNLIKLDYVITMDFSLG